MEDPDSLNGDGAAVARFVSALIAVVIIIAAAVILTLSLGLWFGN